tara:strand:- start:4701 stop:5339 length:639 start_codon:yes stop_codon:yes gene_type:complete
MAIVDKRGTDGFGAIITDIPTAALTQGGNEVHMYPGTYTAPTGVVASDYAYIGMGDADEIIISGDMSFADGSTGSIVFKNITFQGSSATAAGGTSCVSKAGNTAVTLKFENCIFTNSDIGVNQLANLASHAAAGTNGVEMWWCDATAVDKAIVSNANAEINYSALNTGSNAYYTVGDSTLNGDPAHTVTVRASTSGGSNAGNMTETVLALIS